MFCITHPFPDRLLALTLLAFEGLNTAAGKDQCLACLEEAFFPPLWAPLLALYRYRGWHMALWAPLALFPSHPSPACLQERAAAPRSSPGPEHGAAPARWPGRHGAVLTPLPRRPWLRCLRLGRAPPAPHPAGDLSPQEARLHRCGAGDGAWGLGQAGGPPGGRQGGSERPLCAIVRALRGICECAEEYCGNRDSRAPAVAAM